MIARRQSSTQTAGDVRMQFAVEDSKKVQRIVQGSRPQLEDMYSAERVLCTAAHAGVHIQQVGDSDSVAFVRDVDKPAQVALVSQLPWVRSCLATAWLIHMSCQDCCVPSLSYKSCWSLAVRSDEFTHPLSLLKFEFSCKFLSAQQQQ